MAAAEESLLSAPASAARPVHQRAEAAYEPQYQRFLLRAKEFFAHQYAPLYTQRLEALRPLVQRAARARWGAALPARERILQLVEGEECYVIGTVYKDMPLKPSILDEYARDRGLAPALVGAGRQSFTSAEDALLLEDPTGRVRLVAAPATVQALVTGLVLAAKGRALPGGEFELHELCLPEPPPPAPLPPAPPASPRRYLALVSGLQLGPRSPLDPLALQLLLGFLTGSLGAPPDARCAGSVVRVVVAGESLSEASAQLMQAPTTVEHRLRAKAAGAGAGAGAQGAEGGLEALRELDVVMRQVAAAVPVDLMPGRSDPSNHALPQQPFNRCLFPRAAPLANLSCVPNPYAAQVGAVSLLGTAGQPLADLGKYVAARPDLELLEDTLAWAHLAPTAPDSLACYPFYDRDPCALERLPHVYFAANRPAFATKLVHPPGAGGAAVRLVAVPSFAATRTIVLLDLADLSVQPVRFGAYS